MKSIKTLLFLFCAVFYATGFAQEKLSDSDRIEILPYVSEQIEYMPLAARNTLESKLSQIITSNGYGSSIGYGNRFIMTPNISVSDKYIVSGAPTNIALTLDIAFFVGDAATGVKYGSTFMTVKGVGTNETKAYIAALKNIKPNNKKVVELLSSSKQRIIEYYNDCDMVLSDIDKFVATEQYNAALNLMYSIPKVSRACYDKALSKVEGVYKRKIDFDCKQYLTKAKTEWNVGLDLNAANNAGKYLNMISSSSSCYSEVQDFVKEINNKLSEDEKLAWDFLLEKEKSFQEVKKSEIEAFRQVAIEKAKTEPNIFYNVKWW